MESVRRVEEALIIDDYYLPELIYRHHGLTSPKSQTFLNQLCRGGKLKVLELGCYAGASSLAMLFNNDVELTVVDNWSAVEDRPANESIPYTPIENPREIFLSLVDNLNVDVIEGDIFDVEVNLNLIQKRFDIIFYDGPHNLELILGFMMLYAPLFKPGTILVIDDYNFPSVQMGVEIGLDELGLSTVYKKEILTDGESKNDFWNGLGIFIF